MAPLLIFLKERLFFAGRMNTRLSTDQIERYSRQIMVPDLGGKTQIRLRQARALVLAPVASVLPRRFISPPRASGLSASSIPDKVELSNLQRQILHATEEHRPAQSRMAQEKLNRLNPDVEIKTYPDTASTKTMPPRSLTAINSSSTAAIISRPNFWSTTLQLNSDIAFSHAGIVRLKAKR